VINLRAAGGRESLSGCSIVCGSEPVLVAEGFVNGAEIHKNYGIQKKEVGRGVGFSHG
jgi:hypothetical protein